MLGIVCALEVEARAYIAHWKLQKEQDVPFRVYASEDVVLVLSGTGMLAAHAATVFLASVYVPRVLVNIGSAGYDQEKKGEIFRVSQVHMSGLRSGILDVYQTNFMLKEITTHAVVQTSPQGLVDMEAYGFYMAAMRFCKQQNIAVIKYVSDVSGEVTYENMAALAESTQPSIVQEIEGIQAIDQPLHNIEKEEYIVVVGTVSQQRMLTKYIQAIAAHDPEKADDIMETHIPFDGNKQDVSDCIRYVQSVYESLIKS